MRKEAAGSLAYSLTWEPPASPNGIIRSYKVHMHCIVDTARHYIYRQEFMFASEEGEQWNGMLITYVVFYCVQVYSNNSEVANLHRNQTNFTLTQLTPGTLYLISVGALTDAGEGERAERMITTDDAVVKGNNSFVYESTILISHWSLPHSLAFFLMVH